MFYTTPRWTDSAGLQGSVRIYMCSLSPPTSLSSSPTLPRMRVLILSSGDIYMGLIVQEMHLSGYSEVQLQHEMSVNNLSMLPFKDYSPTLTPTLNQSYSMYKKELLSLTTTFEATRYSALWSLGSLIHMYAIFSHLLFFNHVAQFWKKSKSKKRNSLIVLCLNLGLIERFGL